MQLRGVLETCLYVDDLDAAQRFYGEVLGLELFAVETGRHVFFRCGPQMLLLFNPGRTIDPDSDVPVHGGVGAGHVALRIHECEVAAWRARLVAQSVAIERELGRTGGHSLYFRDPAGNSVELATPGIWGLPEA